MDHLKPLPEELLKQLEDYCIPFREHFHQSRIDGGGRHDPIPDPLARLTLSGGVVVAASTICREWRQVERLLEWTKQIRRPTEVTLLGDAFDGLVHQAMTLRPKAMGKSLTTKAMLEALATTSARLVNLGHGLIRPSDHANPDLQPPKGFYGDWFDRDRKPYVERPYSWPTREAYIRPETTNTTDYPLPRGGKRIPKYGEKECKPSNKLLALIARSQ